MPLPNYSHATIRVAKVAGLLAARAGARRVEPEHLLVALLSRQGILWGVLEELAIDPKKIRVRAGELAQVKKVKQCSKPRLSVRMESILLTCDEEARSLGSLAVKPEHLLLAVLRESGPAGKLLMEAGADYRTVRQALRKLLKLPSPARCSKCGYDLRATPEQCPECGEMV